MLNKQEVDTAFSQDLQVITHSAVSTVTKSSTRLTKGYQSFNREPGSSTEALAQMTMAFRSPRIYLKRNLTQEGQCIIRGHDMVHLNEMDKSSHMSSLTT